MSGMFLTTKAPVIGLISSAGMTGFTAIHQEAILCMEEVVVDSLHKTTPIFT
jgi:hypothetical protein